MLNVNQDEEFAGQATKASQVFGVRMREARERLQLSQRAVADKLTESGVRMNASSITRIEKAQREPKISEAAAIASVLGFSMEGLIVSPAVRLQRLEAATRAGVTQAQLGLADAFSAMKEAQEVAEHQRIQVGNLGRRALTSPGFVLTFLEDPKKWLREDDWTETALETARDRDEALRLLEEDHIILRTNEDSIYFRNLCEAITSIALTPDKLAEFLEEFDG